MVMFLMVLAKNQGRREGTGKGTINGMNCNCKMEGGIKLSRTVCHWLSIFRPSRKIARDEGICK